MCVTVQGRLALGFNRATWRGKIARTAAPRVFSTVTLMTIHGLVTIRWNANLQRVYYMLHRGCFVQVYVTDGPQDVVGFLLGVEPDRQFAPCVCFRRQHVGCIAKYRMGRGGWTLFATPLGKESASRKERSLSTYFGQAQTRRKGYKYKEGKVT